MKNENDQWNDQWNRPPDQLVGVASVKVLKTTKEKDYDITKTAGYREAMDDVKNGRVTTYDSVDDMFKKLGINV